MIEIVRRLSIDEQHMLLQACRDVVGQAPLFTKIMPTGAAFRYRCTSAGAYGWMSDRKGYRYETHHPVTGHVFPQIPVCIQQVAVEAAAAYDLSLEPQTALINWYDCDSQLGLHQDKTEVSKAPVVSISLGDDCVFIIGGLKRSDPKSNITLTSGDVLVMGEEHRYIFHGVKKIIPNTAPAELNLRQPGRINITVRQVYD